MRFSMFILVSVILFSIPVVGCSSQSETPKADTSVVLAEVAGEKITLKDVESNPQFQSVVDYLVREKMVQQEFAARKLTLSEDKVKEEWQKYVEGRGGGDEAKALEDLRMQGVTKDFVLAQMRSQLMFTEILNSEYPVTLEDARKEFESNLTTNQQLYAQNVPEKKDNPSSITFDDVAQFVQENMVRRNLSMHSGELLKALEDEYTNKGWVKNYVKPEELKGLTTINKPKEQVEIPPEQLPTAPIKRVREEQNPPPPAAVAPDQDKKDEGKQEPKPGEEKPKQTDGEKAKEKDTGTSDKGK